MPKSKQQMCLVKVCVNEKWHNHWYTEFIEAQNARSAFIRMSQRLNAHVSKEGKKCWNKAKQNFGTITTEKYNWKTDKIESVQIKLPEIQDVSDVTRTYFA